MKLSVVTPSYRQLQWLKLCVASVADQKNVEVEHIIQDGGDDEQLAAWVQNQPVRFFREPDEGMYDAINRGLRRASGQICAYLNCDEQYLPGALEKVKHFFLAHPAVEILFGDVVLIAEDGTPLSYRRTILPRLSHIRASHLNTNSCATFFRHELLERGFYFDARWKAIGDLAWIDELLSQGVRMATISEPLAVFTFTGGNLGTTPVSHRESERWKKEVDAPSGFRAALHIVIHRVRKFLAGAYRRRKIAIAIFTLVSSNRRQHFVEDNVGSNWPDQL